MPSKPAAGGPSAALSLDAFRESLAACKTGMLLVSGEWFEQVKQLSETEQQEYADALAELGYRQLTQTAEGAILLSPSGLSSMQETLQDGLLQAQQHSSSATGHGDASNPASSLQDEDERPEQDQGNQEEQQQSAGGADRDGSASGAPAGGGDNKQQQEEGRGSSGKQDKAQPGEPAACAACLPELPDDDCVRLCLSSGPWAGHGLEGTCLLQHRSSVTCEDMLPLIAQFKRASDVPGVQLDVLLKMEACIQREVRMLRDLLAAGRTDHNSCARPLTACRYRAV